MKKNLVKSGISVLILSFIFFNGCDSFDSLPINIPLSVQVIVTGNSNSLGETASFCLDQYENYNDIAEDINTLTYIEGALRIDSVSNVNLQGDIRIELKNSAGQTLFLVNLNNVKPSNYMINPYIFPLTVDQVQMLNQYIQNLQNKCFNAEVEVTSITGGTTPHYIRAYIDMVFEAETEL